MLYQSLEKKLQFFHEHIHLLAPEVQDNYNRTFDVAYTHHSTAIEGNTLTLMETKVLLEDEVSVGGKSIREIYEVVNHNRAFQYIKQCIKEGKPLDEGIVKDIHEMLMDNIMQGGIYRQVDVYISGAQHTPPSPQKAYEQIKDFFATLPAKASLHPIELAAYTHAEFVRIHPFVDGNGRTARLMMNYQLMSKGYLPVIIKKEDRLSYFECLEQYAVDKNLTPFSELIFQLENDRLDFYNSNMLATHEFLEYEAE